MTKANPEVRGTIAALLVFADIIDSSKYSAVLGYEEYAKRLLYFQKIFRNLGRKYFPEPSDPTLEYSEVGARGDEGVIFLAQAHMQSDFSEPIFRAIEFLYHLKGLLRYGSSSENNASSPRRIGLGAGIHVGRVAFATIKENDRSIIDRIEGFSINYAKRVESCSRLGMYSRIFLSKEAAKLLEDKPVTFSQVNASMKGIEENVEVYEVHSGLFSGLKLDPDNEDEGRLIEHIEMLAHNPAHIEEPWMKSLVVSVLDCLLNNALVIGRRKEYQNSQLKLAWHSAIEDDPILLYLRARDFEEKKEYTQQLRYLKQIVQNNPDFVHARKRLIKGCWALARKKPERSEVVFARDLAKEFLEKFPQLLSEEEKQDFQKLIKSISNRTNPKKANI